MLKIISGTWGEGNGITIHDTETDNFYHLVVYKNSVEIKGNIYYKDDFESMEVLKMNETMESKIIKYAMRKIGTKRVSTLDGMTLEYENKWYNIYVDGNEVTVEEI